MKKRNFITGFSAAFAALVALASCGGIKAKDGVILTINGKEYKAVDLYGDQKSPAASEAKFNAVYKVAVRRYFEEGNDGWQYKNEIDTDTKNKISGSKAEAQSNASKNGTSYDTEWKKILSSNNVEDEDELYDKFEYDLQKAKFEDVLYDKRFKEQSAETGYNTNYDVLRNGGFLCDDDGNAVDTTRGTRQGKKIEGYLSKKMPYHMKHILVKISAKDKDDVGGEITADEARKLVTVIQDLAAGKDFKDVTYNDDATAKQNYGSLGIMSRDTGFVNDFKLGTYLFESLYSELTGRNKAEKYNKYNADIAEYKLFGTRPNEGYAENTAGWYAEEIAKLADPTALSTSTFKLGRIPYGVIQQLDSMTSDGIRLYQMDLTDEKTCAKTVERFKGVDSVKAKYYPRNIIFNKYFNKHNLMVITSDKGPDTFKVGDYLTYNATAKKGTGDDIYYKGEEINKTGLAGFNRRDTSKNEDQIDNYLRSWTDQGVTHHEDVLRDKNGRIIFVFRSGNGSSNANDSSTYQGIHFVVIERSPFVGKEWDDNTGSGDKYTTLQEYYTQYYPGQTDGYHPTYTAGGKDWKKTYTSYTIDSEETIKLKERANTVKTELKKADDNLNTYVYDYLLKKGNIVFNQKSDEAKALETTIDTWIDKTKRGASEKETLKKWTETWNAYYNEMEQRFDNRSYVSDKGLKIAPEILVKAFKGDEIKDDSHTYTLKEIFGKEGAYND